MCLLYYCSRVIQNGRQGFFLLAAVVAGRVWSNLCRIAVLVWRLGLGYMTSVLQQQQSGKQGQLHT